MNDIIDELEVGPKKKKAVKWVKITEIIGISLLASGLMFTEIHWFGGAELMLAGTLILAIVYAFFLVPSTRPALGSGRIKTFVIAASIVMALSLVGSLFKFFLWSMSESFLFAHYLCLLGAVLMLFYRNRNAISLVHFKRFFPRYLIVSLIGLALSLIPARDLFRHKMGGDASEKLLNAFEDNYNNPGDRETSSRYNQLRKQHLDSINDILSAQPIE